MSIATELSPLRVADQPLPVRQALCRKSVLAWAANCWPGRVKPFWHSKLIDDRLNRLYAPDSENLYLMISQPPRTGKTMLSVLFGATKYLAMNPDFNIFYVTYSQTFANRIGRQAKLIFQTHAPEIFGVELDPKSKSNACWGVKGYEGSFNAIGWGGALVGQKVHLLIADDLIKSPEEALSQNIRETLWQWWDGSATQRIQRNKELKTRVCCIQTRWHTDDLNGRLLQQERAGGAMRWDKCILPAIADRGDVYDGDRLLMRKGESLCDEILPVSYLEDQKRTKSRFFWECTFQQRPITQDGLLWTSDCFPDDHWVDAWPNRVKYLVVGVDPATGRALRDGDYSALVALGVGYDGKLYCQADMDKTGPVETIQRLTSFCRTLPMAPDSIAIESNGFQFIMRAMAEEAFANDDVAGRIEAYDTSERDVPTHKEDRIAELDPLIVSKDIHWVRCPGTQLLVSQLQNFPSQDHDDGPDALELASWVLSNYEN